MCKSIGWLAGGLGPRRKRVLLREMTTGRASSLPLSCEERLGRQVGTWETDRQTSRKNNGTNCSQRLQLVLTFFFFFFFAPPLLSRTRTSQQALIGKLAFPYVLPAVLSGGSALRVRLQLPCHALWAQSYPRNTQVALLLSMPTLLLCREPMF